MWYFWHTGICNSLSSPAEGVPGKLLPVICGRSPASLSLCPVSPTLMQVALV